MGGWVGDRWVGEWLDKTKLILISTLVEVVVKVEVELGNRIKSKSMEFLGVYQERMSLLNRCLGLCWCFICNL